MFEQAFKNIDDVLWKDAGCISELDYTEQTSWLLFLKYLDALEHDKAALGGKKYAHMLDSAYRWEAWAAPKGKDGAIDHKAALTGNDLLAFVNAPSLSELKTTVAELNELSEETQRLARLYERRLAALDELNKSLLHQAFSGEL